MSSGSKTLSHKLSAVESFVVLPDSGLCVLARATLEDQGRRKHSQLGVTSG